MEQKKRIQLENGLIGVLGLLSAILFIVSFIPIGMLSDKVRVYMEMSKMVERVLCLIMLILCGQLMLRKHMAWSITMIILFINFVRGILGVQHSYRIGMAVVSAFFLLCFYYFREDFCCSPSKASEKRAIIYLLLSFVGILVNAGLSFHYMKLAMHHPISIGESFLDGIGMLFGIVTIPAGKGIHYFASLIFLFSWICIIVAILYAVRPWLVGKKNSKSDIQHARTLLNLYSQNPAAYLTLEEDKTLFFGEKVDGVIPYGVVRDVIVMNGDPVCAPEDFPILLEEFKQFCHKTAHKLFILNATDAFIEEYKRQGFGYVKCGEEARFNL